MVQPVSRWNTRHGKGVGLAQSPFFLGLGLGCLVFAVGCRPKAKPSGDPSGASTNSATIEERDASLALAAGTTNQKQLAPAARIERVVRGRWPTLAVRTSDRDAWLVLDRETEPALSAVAIAALVGPALAFERLTFAADDALFAATSAPGAAAKRVGDGGSLRAVLVLAPSEGSDLSLAQAVREQPTAATEALALRYLTGRGDAPLSKTPQGELADGQYADAFTDLSSGAQNRLWKWLSKDRVSPAFVKRLLALDEAALGSMHDARGHSVECGVIRRELVMQRRHELLSRIAP